MKILLLCNYRPGVGGISGQVEALRRHLCAEGHRADVFNCRGNILRRLLMPWALERTARHYDVLHIHCCSHLGFWPAVLGVSCGRRLGKRTVVTYHGGGAEPFFSKHPRLVFTYLAHTDVNILLNGHLAPLFARHHLRYVIIPNIIELDPSLYRERTTLRPRYVCTRAHEELYNLPCLLRAFAMVQAHRPDATLTLVGDGSQHQQLRRLAADLGLRHVHFTGRVDNSQIYHHLDEADIFVSCPKVDNMPVSLLEAMNAGLPVVSTRVGGVPFMVRDGHDALLCLSDDPAALADRMLHPLDHPDEALLLARNAHAAVQRYSWANVRTPIYHAYNITT